MKYFIALLLALPIIGHAQIEGRVIQMDNKEPIVGAKIQASNGEKVISDFDGNFKITAQSFPVTLITTMTSFKTDTLIVNSAGLVTILLDVPVKTMSTVVVSAGRRQQKVEEVPVSMEIIKPSLIDNKGIADLEQAVDQSPGVYTMDGQVSIRGGSGYSYGTGSRVLLLWNGMPLLSGYAGDTQWNAIPMEQASQIEIMKGASSVLYGSGALNGVIALTEKEPNFKPETKVKIQHGIYDNPARSTLKWWKQNPVSQQLEAYHGRMFKYAGFTVSTTLFNNEGYRQGESEKRARISGTVYFRFKKNNRVKAGIGYNYQYQKTGNFLIWRSDTFAYTPSGGADTSLESSTLTYNRGQRLFIDPYIKFTDKKNNKHSFKTRVYFAENTNLNNTSQSNGAVVYYTDYQFQRQFGNGMTITSGLSNIYNDVNSNLFGNHTSNNASLYAQYEHKLGKLDLTAGMRVEHFQMDGKSGDSDYLLSRKDSLVLPVYPIFRAGVHYEVFKFTHLRASIGQGIRYPSVAERYTQTSVGAINIFPNPLLRPEKGWAAEIGIKQGVKIGDWKGMIDVAGFINEYDNMTEFAFGIFNPETGAQFDLTNPADVATFFQFVTQGYDAQSMYGFQAQNAEKARITGVEFSFNSTGKIGEVEIVSLMGYTYMRPLTKNDDPIYRKSFSDTVSGLLKYRFEHLIKADIECNYKFLSVGFSARYNSYMSNIDRIFEDAILGTYVLPGLKEYRKSEKDGSLVFDARLGFKINEQCRLGLICNNILNNEYSARPGDIQPPRNYQLQLQLKL